jgi:hypothetical protein
MVDGQWHSFGNAAGGRAAAAPALQPRAGASAEGGVHVLTESGSAGVAHATRSFSGQGNQVWENAAMARNVVSSSRALSNVRGSFGDSFVGSARLRSGAIFSANPRISGASVFGNRVFSGGPGANRMASFGNRFQFGNNRFGYRRGPRGGCWNCGFGWGFGFGWWPGWGFGWPWLGYWNWDPFYWDSLTWGWPGYGSYGYPWGYPYGYGQNYYNYSSSHSIPEEDYTDTDSSSVTAAPSEPSSPQTYSAANVAVPVLLFLKNGLVYSARDYWFSGDQIHYVLTNGREGAFDADQLDMQRTNDENAKSGVPFVVKTDPNGFAPAPDDFTPSLEYTGSGNTSSPN